MKVVLFCGGLGMRMRDGVSTAPKPMAMVGDRPLHLACHALLRALRPHRFRALPWLWGVGGQGFLPELRRDEVQRFRPRGRRPGGEAVQDRHLRLADHLRRHRPELGRSASGCAGYAGSSTTSRCSWPTTRTSSPTRRCPTWSHGSRPATRVASLLAVPPQSSHHVVDIGEDGLITQVTPMRDLRQWENGGYFVLRPGDLRLTSTRARISSEDALCGGWSRSGESSPTRTRDTGHPPTR